MVMHYRDISGCVQHKSYVGISEEKSHSAPTTLGFITKVMPELKKVLPNLKTVHFISDSPASQYRNRSIVQLVANFPAYFNGINASWQFLEKGHGKGPCDGVGGSLKKAADQAVKQGAIISGAQEFFRWAEKSTGAITCVFLTSQEIKSGEHRLHNPGYLKGISSIHSLRPYGGHLWMRETSCFQPCCSAEPGCPGWMNTGFCIKTVEENVNIEISLPVTRATSATVEGNKEGETEKGQYIVGDLVEAEYEGKRYIGEIKEYSQEEQDFLISFMRKGRKNHYVWPKKVDQVWVIPEHIIRVVRMQDGRLLE
jgi:hypothetical protein